MPFVRRFSSRAIAPALSALLLPVSLVLGMGSAVAEEGDATTEATETTEDIPDAVDEMPDPSTWSLEARASYIMGYYISQQLQQQIQQGGFSRDMVLVGLSAGIQGEQPHIPQQAWNTVMQTYQEQQEQRSRLAAAQNKADEEEYMANLQEQDGVTVTDSGLAYEVLTAAEGAKPTADNTVRVHYEGKLLDGSVFDSSIARNDPVQFPLNGVIAGWTEALQLMSVGSKYRLHIPAELAYGAEGRPGIPPNSTLIFDVELLEIVE